MDYWVIELIGFAGTACTVASYSMRTIVPLRIAGIASSVMFIWYGWQIQSLPMLATEFIILPLNLVRLYQVLKLTRQIGTAADGEMSVEWLTPFAHDRSRRAGEVIFRAGDAADHMLVIKSGRFRLVEADIELGAGELVGEMGFLAPDNRRTMTLECIGEGVVGQVSYFDLKQLYFSNPSFAFYLLQLVSQRLFENVERAGKRAVAG